MRLRYRRMCLLTAMILTMTVMSAFAQQLKSPSEFLGYELGTQFTPHYKVMKYFRYVAEQSGLVQFKQYGTTYEGRELNYAVVATGDHLAHLEEIRTNNLKRIGLMDGEPTNLNPAIVWLSYNVHGNEAASSEAAMKVIFELARSGNAQTKQWLQNVVVVMDPMINPDGRDRYVAWYNHHVGAQPDASPDAREHDEPWVSGRVNHYYFDLNRDWAWQVQKETQQRIKLYQQWMPQLHVDYHEMGYNEPYYFAPAAVPFHKQITDWQRQFQTTVGKNHARHFDQNNWLYFTRQVYDLFYPSYGDTWPIFNGAIGMTYEQGGIGAGLAVKTADEDTLTLKDRMMHHFTTSLSTIETAAAHHDELVQHFDEYYQKSMQNPDVPYKSFVIKAGNQPDHLKALLAFLDQEQIRYGYASRDGRYEAYDYRSGSSRRVQVSENDIVVSAFQPHGKLASVLFSPKPVLSDSITYDITAWELPYIYGVEAYAMKDRINPGNGSVTVDVPSGVVGEAGDKPYAYLAEWKSREDLQLLVELLKKDVKVRVGEIPFTINGRSYDPGTLIITRNGNTKMGDNFDRIVSEVAQKVEQPVYPVSTGFVDSGADFGSSDVHYIKKPRVALLAQSPTSSASVGEIWHYFDQQIDYPLTIINNDRFSRVNWYNYDVLILPNGYYSSDFLSKEQLENLKEWISKGGKLIAVEGAVSFLEGKDGFSVKRKEMKKKQEQNNEAPVQHKYANREREAMTRFNTGSIFRVSMDNTHPLGFGYGDQYFSLKLDSDAYDYLDSGWSVGVAKTNAQMSGFAGYKALQKLDHTLVFGEQDMGRGSVVYMVDNPLFRGFWYNGKLLFGNAVFMVGQ